MRDTTDPGAAALINVNTASLDELQAISGVGDALGKAIIEQHQWEGPFQSVDDPTKIDGIDAGSLNPIHDPITVDAAHIRGVIKAQAAPLGRAARATDTRAIVQAVDNPSRLLGAARSLSLSPPALITRSERLGLNLNDVAPRLDGEPSRRHAHAPLEAPCASALTTS